MVIFYTPILYVERQKIWAYTGKVVASAHNMPNYEMYVSVQYPHSYEEKNSKCFVLLLNRYKCTYISSWKLLISPEDAVGLKTCSSRKCYDEKSKS